MVAVFGLDQVEGKQFLLKHVCFEAFFFVSDIKHIEKMIKPCYKFNVICTTKEWAAQLRRGEYRSHSAMPLLVEVPFLPEFEELENMKDEHKRQLNLFWKTIGKSKWGK